MQSLGPPDGKFMECMKAAIEKVNAKANPDKPVVFRLMFGNIIGMPVRVQVLFHFLVLFFSRILVHYVVVFDLTNVCRICCIARMNEKR